MGQKDRLDAFGTVSLVMFSALLGFNQVVIKVGNGGFEPVFFAGLRSLGAIVCIAAWMRFRGLELRPRPGTWGAGLAIGCLFALEFTLLFTALDLTSVTRVSVIFYSMPVWMALGAHVLLPGQRLTRGKVAGLTLAFAGVAYAIVSRGESAGGSLAGDLCALAAAVAWAGLGLMARGTVLREETPEKQLLWQVAVSAPLLILVAPLFGPLIRELQPIHLWALGFQTVVMVSAGFIFWLWLLSIYPPASVAAYSFLGPIFGAGFGWLLLSEELGPSILIALAMVAGGLWLMNRPPRPGRGAGDQVPQKV